MFCGNELFNNSVSISLHDVIKNSPDNKAIGEAFVITWSKLKQYQKIVCSVSGGSDSDVLLDLIVRCDTERKVTYVFFDTGIESAATKEHLNELEKKYGITIVRLRAQKTVPAVCREHGQPFLNKRVSENISRLQSHNFQWEDEPIEILLEKYCQKPDEKKYLELETLRIETGVTYVRPWTYRNGTWYSGCVASLEWWCNCTKGGGKKSQCNISHNKWLKEFMVENPPTHNISSKCCKYAKKDVIHDYIKGQGFDLNIFGVRKAEGGVRATSYRSCFTHDSNEKCDEYRPIFWFKNDDKELYNQFYKIENSRCYSCYGLTRTGCVGCPMSPNLERELEVFQKYEPKLYQAVSNIFHDSYAYLRSYRAYAKKKNLEEKARKKELSLNGCHQLTFYDLFF